MDGTHHQLSRTHLHRDLNEFDFRYSTCELFDSARMEYMVDQAGAAAQRYEPLNKGYASRDKISSHLARSLW